MKKSVIMNAALRAGAVNAVHHNTLQKGYGKLFRNLGNFMLENPETMRATLVATTCYTITIVGCGVVLHAMDKRAKSLIAKMKEDMTTMHAKANAIHDKTADLWDEDAEW